MRAVLPLAALLVERRLELRDRTVRIRESVENVTACDRPIGWTEHVTLGPPFLEKGLTEFRVSATRSKVFERAFGVSDYLLAGATFEWPLAPRIDGGTTDLRRFTDAASSSAYTAHLMDADRRGRVLRRLCANGAPGVRLRLEAARTSRGWESGRRTTVARMRRGTARR